MGPRERLRRLRVSVEVVRQYVEEGRTSTPDEEPPHPSHLLPPAVSYRRSMEEDGTLYLRLEDMLTVNEACFAALRHIHLRNAEKALVQDWHQNDSQHFPSAEERAVRITALITDLLSGEINDEVRQHVQALGEALGCCQQAIRMGLAVGLEPLTARASEAVPTEQAARTVGKQPEQSPQCARH